MEVIRGIDSALEGPLAFVAPDVLTHHEELDRRLSRNTIVFISKAPVVEADLRFIHDPTRGLGSEVDLSDLEAARVVIPGTNQQPLARAGQLTIAAPR